MGSNPHHGPDIFSLSHATNEFLKHLSLFDDHFKIYHLSFEKDISGWEHKMLSTFLILADYAGQASHMHLL